MKLKNITLAIGMAAAGAKSLEGYRSQKCDALNLRAALHQWFLNMHAGRLEILFFTKLKF
jgi:hypothetical protein